MASDHFESSKFQIVLLPTWHQATALNPIATWVLFLHQGQRRIAGACAKGWVNTPSPCEMENFPYHIYSIMCSHAPLCEAGAECPLLVFDLENPNQFDQIRLQCLEALWRQTDEVPQSHSAEAPLWGLFGYSSCHRKLS